MVRWRKEAASLAVVLALTLTPMMAWSQDEWLVAPAETGALFAITDPADPPAPDDTFSLPSVGTLPLYCKFVNFDTSLTPFVADDIIALVSPHPLDADTDFKAPGPGGSILVDTSPVGLDINGGFVVVCCAGADTVQKYEIATGILSSTTDFSTVAAADPWNCVVGFGITDPATSQVYVTIRTLGAPGIDTFPFVGAPADFDAAVAPMTANLGAPYTDPVDIEITASGLNAWITNWAAASVGDAFDMPGGTGTTVVRFLLADPAVTAAVALGLPTGPWGLKIMIGEVYVFCNSGDCVVVTDLLVPAVDPLKGHHVIGADIGFIPFAAVIPLWDGAPSNDFGKMLITWHTPDGIFADPPAGADDVGGVFRVFILGGVPQWPPIGALATIYTGILPPDVNTCPRAIAVRPPPPASTAVGGRKSGGHTCFVGAARADQSTLPLLVGLFFGFGFLCLGVARHSRHSAVS